MSVDLLFTVKTRSWRVCCCSSAAGVRGSTHTRALCSLSFNHNFPESLDLVPYAVHELFVLLGFRFFSLQLFAESLLDIDETEHYIITDYVSV